LNHYLFDTKRTKCSYCGSSDGFAHLLNPTTRQVVAAGLGKCHSCNVFRTQTEAGFVSDTGDLVASAGVVEAKYYDVAKVKAFGLTLGVSPIVEFAKTLFGDIAQSTAEQMLVCGDKGGNSSFLYVDTKQRGMSVKTIAYDAETGKRSKDGLAWGSRRFETSQIAGYVTPEGSIRTVRVSDGSYQLLYGQHRLVSDNRPVIIVESEKTAYIATAATDQAVFLAAGGSKGLSANKVRGLRKANAVPDDFADRLHSRQVTVCFDYDESGESGAVLASEAMRELGADHVEVCNCEELLTNVNIGFPAHLREHCDLADIFIWCMTHGKMYEDINKVMRYLLKKGSSESVVERAIEAQELQRITKYDHEKEPPRPSLSFVDPANGRSSQLAIPGNIVMLLASPGVGKSSIVSAMVAKHIHTSADAFGLEIDAPNGIVVVDTEQSRDQVVGLHRRLARRVGYHAEDMPEVFEQRSVNWFVTNKRLQVEKQVDNLFAAVATYNPSFVIVDQIGSLVKNVNSIDETTALVKRIADDAETNMRTWIVVLHTNPTSDKGRGVLGSDIHRWAASVLFVRKPAEAGEPSLLTTNNADGTMAKIRAGAPVRVFFAWDNERGDFYPTQKTQKVEVELPTVLAAVHEIFNAGQVSQPMGFVDLRKKIKDLFGATDGAKIFNYLINGELLKRQPNGKLWPDYEKLQAANSSKAIEP
jgi:hypothetical protein